MGLFDKIGQAVSKAGADVVRVASLTKAELELAEIERRYNDCYVIIGKRIAEQKKAALFDDP